jgi:hypothetical protein
LRLAEGIAEHQGQLDFVDHRESHSIAEYYHSQYGLSRKLVIRMTRISAASIQQPIVNVLKHYVHSPTAMTPVVVTDLVNKLMPAVLAIQSAEFIHDLTSSYKDTKELDAKLAEQLCLELRPIFGPFTGEMGRGRAPAANWISGLSQGHHALVLRKPSAFDHRSTANITADLLGQFPPPAAAPSSVPTGHAVSDQPNLARDVQVLTDTERIRAAREGRAAAPIVPWVLLTGSRIELTTQAFQRAVPPEGTVPAIA